MTRLCCIQLQSPAAWQCGVPSRAGHHVSTSSDGDEIITEAEMNMGDAFGDSPFQQAAHRYPSFDEDDDDAEEVRILHPPPSLIGRYQACSLQ